MQYALNVHNRSISSFRAHAAHFWSSPISRRSQSPSARLKGATRGHSIIAVPLLIRSHLPRENVMNPSLFGIRTFGSVWALIASFSPMMPLSCNK